MERYSVSARGFCPHVRCPRLRNPILMDQLTNVLRLVTDARFLEGQLAREHSMCARIVGLSATPTRVI